MNANFTRDLLKAIAPTVNFQIGDVGKIPVTPSLGALPASLNELVETSRADWDTTELSWGFERNPLVAPA